MNGDIPATNGDVKTEEKETDAPETEEKESETPKEEEANESTGKYKCQQTFLIQFLGLKKFNNNLSYEFS